MKFACLDRCKLDQNIERKITSNELNLMLEIETRRLRGTSLLDRTCNHYLYNKTFDFLAETVYLYKISKDAFILLHVRFNIDTISIRLTSNVWFNFAQKHHNFYFKIFQVQKIFSCHR